MMFTIITVVLALGVLAGAVAYRDEPGDISQAENGTPQEIFASQFILIPGGKP